eukprot:gnl/MRDRNA2_/MRDRNA2_362290_c0_seq1.p1 gnl/MRDRNA2_/MRDRNA2_362290_c0~~gnl/MRDRNA2_/MRDRNA2_362290_c0_seq1.p1  ORF type:complete len:359 (+),score=48.07 gnl/MRDRNA2_/MRDRNA2_362290_c0_seq1:100-1077(+)
MAFLIHSFPQVRALQITGHVPDVDDWGLWTSLRGVVSVGKGGRKFPECLCLLSGLQQLAFQGVRIIPNCVGEMANLVELDVRSGELANFVELDARGSSDSGPSSTPALHPALAELSNLRSFVAFQQGRFKHECPPHDEPERNLCRADYESRVDGSDDSSKMMVTWMCPQNSWNPRFDDRSNPFWSWHNLERFWVDDNYFSGSIPDFIADDWPHLRSLDLYNNNLTGKLPSALLKLTNLTKLQLHVNNFTCDEERRAESMRADGVVAKLSSMPSMAVFTAFENPHLCGCVPIAKELHDDLLPMHIVGTNISRSCVEEKGAPVKIEL